MMNLDAMVLPSLFGEGMPMVVLDALALGVPVIATKVEGTPELFVMVLKGCWLNRGVRARFQKKSCRWLRVVASGRG